MSRKIIKKNIKFTKGFGQRFADATTKLLKGSQHTFMVNNITKYLNQCLGSFYVVGDLYHDPMSFGLDVLTKNLYGDSLQTAQRQMLSFLFEQPNVWNLEVFHFFDDDGIVECVPVKGTFEDMTLGIMADLTTAFIEETREVLFEMPEYECRKDKYSHFGYYINWGTDIDYDHMDPLITEAFFKISRDLSVKKKPASISGKRLIDCMVKTPAQLTDSEGILLTTDMIEVTEKLIASLMPKEEEVSHEELQTESV